VRGAAAVVSGAFPTWPLYVAQDNAGILAVPFQPGSPSLAAGVELSNAGAAAGAAPWLRTYQPLILGGLFNSNRDPAAQTAPPNWQLHAVTYTNSSCACNSAWTVGATSGAVSLPSTTNQRVAPLPGADIGLAGASVLSAGQVAGWFRSPLQLYACDASRQKLLFLTRAQALPTSPWTAQTIFTLPTAGLQGCSSVTGRVEGLNTIVYVVAAPIGATESSSNSVIAFNMTTLQPRVIVTSPTTTTFRSVFLPPCSSAVQGASGLTCPQWLDGVAYLTGLSGGLLPSPSATASPAMTPTPSPTPSGTGTPSPGSAATRTATPSPTHASAASASASAAPAPAGAGTASPSPSKNATLGAPGASAVDDGTVGGLSLGSAVGIIVGAGVGLCCGAFWVNRALKARRKGGVRMREK
jgi:hypothetical protein